MTMGSLRQMLRFVSPEECQSLQDICEYNDITEEQLVSAPEKIYSIEMFMHNLPRICCMSFFPNLVSLSLIQQGITCIEGLYCCQSLEILRLSENKIQRVEGLQSCLKLKELYLHSNKISQIKNLSHFTDLQVLWLANNEISWVEGLESLVNLKELSLARNPISQLGEILEMKSLECLNVAATSIGSFKEIGSLTRMKNLKELRFSDPHWGDSPLALLHNYQTYVLFRLRHLQKLDTLDLTEEAKQAAKAIYTRKRVYYNMCIKSLQHSRNSAVANVVRGECKRMKTIQKTIAKLMKTLKDLEKEMYEAIKAEQDSKSTKKELAAIEGIWDHAFAKATTVDKQIQYLMGKLDYLVEDMQMSKAKEQAAVDLSIHWLMMELDTGGNIRMEVGKTKDPWFKQCEELVVSRFLTADFAPFGITGVDVVKVTRIHNRFLQDRLAQLLENMRPTKKATEYLLYGETLQAPDELQWIIEEGFPFLPDNFSPRGPDIAVLLSNSIGLADLHRLKALPKQFQQTTFWRSRATGWLLVVKACLGTSIQDSSDSPTVKKAAFPSADSVYRLHPKDQKQKSWFVFDPTHLLPEYLVEFKYKFEPDSQDSPARPNGSTMEAEGALISDRGRGSEVPLASSLEQQLTESLLTIPKISPSEFRSWLAETCTPVSRDDKSVLLRDEYIMRRSSQKDLHRLTHLNLHSCNIIGIEHLKSLTGLKVLVLSFNKLTKIQGLEEMQSLRKLDLSFNLLKRIDGLSGASNLESLELTGNELWNLDDLAVLHAQVPQLLKLNLRCNPLVEEFGYRTMALRTVPSLKTLDCIPVMAEDRDDSLTKINSTPDSPIPSSLSQWSTLPPSPPCSLTIDENSYKSDEMKGIMCLKGQAENACRRQSHVRLNPYTKLLRLDILNPFTKLLKGLQNHATSLKEDRVWYEGVEEVHLEHRRLRTMHCFDRLPNLRRLFLTGNEICVIEGLENCTMLEELILEDNRIKQVKGLSQLQSLWKLDLGRNQLTSCVAISSCPALTQLSIEENNISSLEGLASLSCLMELYAANNQLTDMRELFHIRDLPKLMVVDLSGNSLCQGHDYRTYTIFSLRKLKVLDGKNVDSCELTEARNKYLGRLTRDVLEECLGHNHFSQIKKMDLSSQSLRHTGDVFRMMELQGLVELNLNNNLFTSLQALRYLKNLVILRLENNKFENGPIIEHSSASDAENASPRNDGKNCATSLLLPLEVEVLELGGNNISSIASLCLAQTFPKLRLLSLQYNRITKVDGLEGMARLEKLLIGHNNIKELDPYSFIGLVNLKSLHMGDNTLRTLAHIGNLPSLQILDVSSNFLTSNRFGCLSSIDNLAFLPGLIELSLTNNPMTRQHMYRTAVVSKLTQLNSLDSKEISTEERLEAEHYLAGKEGAVPCSDLHTVLESSSNGHVGAHNGQGKVPLKVTSLDFDAMCTQNLPPSPQNNGAKVVHAPTTAAQTGQIGPPKPWEPGDVKHSGSHLIQSYFKSRMRGEQKVIVLPLDVLMVRNSHVKDRTIPMYEPGTKPQP